MQDDFIIRDTRVKDHFIMDDQYLNGYARLCGIYASGVYMSLCRHANKDQEAWPSQSLIAEELGINRRSVIKAIKILIEWGILIASTPKRVKGRFETTIYILADKSTWKTKPCAPDTHGTVCTSGTSPCARQVLHRVHPVHNKDSHRKDSQGRRELAVDKSGDKPKKPYLEGDMAWQDPNDPEHWRVKTHSGEWCDYIGDVKTNLSWR